MKSSTSKLGLRPNPNALISLKSNDDTRYSLPRFIKDLQKERRLRKQFRAMHGAIYSEHKARLAGGIPCERWVVGYILYSVVTQG